MNFMIFAVIAGVLLIAAGLWMINRANSPDEASGGFGLAFIGAVILAFALLVVFVSMARVRARDLDRCPAGDVRCLAQDSDAR